MALWSCIKMEIFIMVIRHPSTGWLYLCVWAAQSSWVRWLHTWISHIPGLSIFHQTHSSIMDAAHQPRPSPDRGRLIALVQPFLRRDDVHAPQPPVVAMGSIGVLLHLKRVVFDVVYGRQDDAGVILLHPGQDRLSPCIRQDTKVELIQMLLCRKGGEKGTGEFGESNSLYCGSWFHKLTPGALWMTAVLVSAFILTLGSVCRISIPATFTAIATTHFPPLFTMWRPWKMNFLRNNKHYRNLFYISCSWKWNVKLWHLSQWKTW